MSSSVRETLGTQPKCSPDCMRYKGTLDVLYKVIQQVLNFSALGHMNAL